MYVCMCMCGEDFAGMLSPPFSPSTLREMDDGDMQVELALRLKPIKVKPKAGL